MKSESEIVRRLADEKVKWVVNAVRREFQSMRDCMTSGDDSGLDNVWDEICVQVQGEEPVLWEDAYVPTIIQSIESYLPKLDDFAKSAIWYQTDNGWNYASYRGDKEEQERILADCNPDEDIVDYIYHKVLRLAADWENSRIRAYQGRSEMDDELW